MAPSLRTLRAHPASLILIVHFGCLAIVPAYIGSSANSDFVLAVVLIAAGSAFLVETLLRPFKWRIVGHDTGPSPRWSYSVLTIGVLAHVVGALGGSRSYAAQVGETSVAWWVSLATPLTSFMVIGVALVLCAWKREEITRSAALLPIIGTCLLLYALGLRNGLVGAATAFTLMVVVLMVMMGAITVRQSVVGVMLLLLLWPTVREARNAVRSDVLGTAISNPADDPYERLQLDEQIAYAQELEPFASSIGEPTWTTVIRTGLLPSVLDSNRPPLDTGSRMSVALGGSSVNSQSATVLGNVLLFTGWGGLFAFAGLLAGVLVLALRKQTAWGMCVFALVYFSLLSLSASYPDGVAKLLQALEALVLVGVLHSLQMGVRRRRSGGRLKRLTSNSRDHMRP